MRMLSVIFLLWATPALFLGRAAAGEAQPAKTPRNILIEVRWIKISDTEAAKASEKPDQSKDASAIDKGSLISAPRLVVKDGVRGSTSDGKERAFRSEVRVKEEGALAAEVAPAPVFEGARIEALPTISADGKTIHLQLKLAFQRVTAVEEVKTKVVLRSAGKMEEHEFALERPVVESTKVDTEVDVPDGSIVLLQGHTMDKQSTQAGVTSATRSNVAVLVTARVLLVAGAEEK